MAEAREIPEIAPDASFRAAAAGAIAVRTEELFSFAEGVLDTADIERVHDMRVASRRLRAVMEVFAPCFSKREFVWALNEVKALADDLGRRRDPDVAIETLEGIADGLTSEDRPGVAHLTAALAARQTAGNEVLSKRLERMELTGLKVRLLALAAEVRAS